MTCFNIIKPIFDVKTLNLNFFLIKYMAIKTKSPRQKTCRMNIRIYSAGKIVMNISKYEYICHKIYEYEYPIIIIKCKVSPLKLLTIRKYKLELSCAYDSSSWVWLIN